MHSLKDVKRSTVHGVLFTVNSKKNLAEKRVL